MNNSFYSNNNNHSTTYHYEVESFCAQAALKVCPLVYLRKHNTVKIGKKAAALQRQTQTGTCDMSPDNRSSDVSLDNNSSDVSPDNHSSD